MKYLILDTETTGLPLDYNGDWSDVHNWPRMVQLAYLLYEGKQLIAEVCRIVRPEGFEIPERATQLHGISSEQAQKEGKPLRLVLDEFSRYVGQDPILVAHNINFDQPIVVAEYLRTHPEHHYDHNHLLFANMTTICTKERSTLFCQLPKNKGYAGYKWPSLQELHYKLFDSGFADAHDALEDARATARCFFELKRLKVI